MPSDPIRESTISPGRAKWLEANAKRAEIAALDLRRTALLEDARALEDEARRLGRQEGWHV
jgi:hypothetical protein